MIPKEYLLKKRGWIGAILAFCLLAVVCVPVYDATAGVSSTVISGESDFSAGINAGEWYYTDGVEARNNRIHFMAAGNNGTRIASRKQFFDVSEEGFDTVFDATMVLNIAEIPEGSRFAINFGLRIPALQTGTANSSMLYFTKREGALCMGLSVFPATGGEQTIEEAIAVDGFGADWGRDFSLRFTVGAGGSYFVAINDEEAMAADSSDVNTEGYFGFGQTAATDTEIGELHILAYENATPENFRYTETFSGTFHSSAFEMRTAVGCFAPSYLKVEDGVLRFRNTASSYISSKYVFSNVDLEFEVPELRRVCRVENGEIVEPVSSEIMMIFGAEKYTTVDSAGAFSVSVGPADYSPIRSAAATAIRLKVKGQTVETVILPAEFNLWGEENEGRPFNIRACLRDGSFELFVKFSDQNAFRSVATYDLGFTPEGYVQLAGSGTNVGSADWMDIRSLRQGNFAIDNLTLYNRDRSAVLVELGQPGKLPGRPDDFDYVDSWQDSDLPFGGND